MLQAANSDFLKLISPFTIVGVKIYYSFTN